MGSSCVSLGVFSPLGLGVRLFFFWMFCLQSLAVLRVLHLQLKQLVSLHCEACREPFSRRFRHPKFCKSQQDQLDAVALVQCGCDIAPAGTWKRDHHSFGDVVVRGFAPVRFDFVFPDRLCDCCSWAFLIDSRHHF